ncbi:hypothetical protein GCM10009789_17820 [Kribbella sancticallisti]|uniref:Uncharacterized protein n=1 Tax=Kribbella sancticallisti TaxID=460087 RepID=A0ABP4NPU6_9ACTN
MTAAPTSLATLLQKHARAALRISRADQTAWNGKVVEAGEGILGLAHWDGTLHLDRDCILDPLQEMYDRSGEHQSEAALIRYREALVTLLHEQSHFLGPTGSTQEAARSAFKLLGGRHLEEGVAEAWAHDSLNTYIHKLGIDKVAPGITETRSQPSYAAFVPAVRLLTADLDRQAQLPPGESLRLLNRQTAEGQWSTVVNLIYHSSRLSQLVPPDQEPAARFHLEEALRTSFHALETYEPFPRGFATSRSHAAGTRLITLLHQELATAEKHYDAPTSPALNHSRQRPATTSAQPKAAIHHALAGVAPPTHQPSPQTPSPSPSPSPSPARAISNSRSPTSDLSL